MKIFSQRIATFVAFASFAYLASTPSVLGQKAGDATEMNTADPIGQHTFNAFNNDNPEKHHHHHKHHRKPHHDKHPIAKKVHLVCDGKVIDTLKCRVKACGAIATDFEVVDSNSVDASSSTFDAKNNGGTDSIPQVFIKMDFPCSKNPPKGCAADVAASSQDAIDPTEETDATETSDDSEETESEDSDTIELAKRDNAADTDFEASNHGAGHKHKHHHHSRHHRHGKHHHHNKHSQKNKHPWKDLCVAVGDFCGSSLYGCDFNEKTWYRCSAIGERPTVIKVDAEECGAPVKKCPCPADFVLAVCGSELPEKCHADPTEIYYCPGGPFSDFEVLKKCLPGTVCVPGKDGNDAICGYQSCKCTGDKEYCSSQFPKRCGLQENTIYKCVDDKLEPFKSCDDTAQECVATGDGAVCGSCKCSVDGEICGDAFPLKCRRSATGLYKCKKGESPELIKECLPGFCSTSAASLSSIVFESEAAKDVCIDGCSCVKEGDFCGGTFSPGCGLHANTLYKCSGPRATPEWKEKCDKGCIVRAGANVCRIDCTCPAGVTDVCGSDFPPGCKLNVDTIYKCSGKGSHPFPGEQCNPGECKDLAGGAKCSCGSLVADALNALGSIEPLLVNAINTGGSIAVVVSVLTTNLDRLKLDLNAADPLGLSAIAGPAKQLVEAASDLLDTLNVPANAATTALITALRALATTLGAVNVCAGGGNSNDCNGIIQLFREIKTAVFGLINVIPGIGTFSTQLETAIGTIDSALESGSGALVGQAIGIIDGVIGGITAIPLLRTALAPIIALFEAAKAAVKCLLNIDPPATCLIFNQQFAGALTALIDIVRDNLNMIPIFGPFISTPLLTALNQVLVDVQTGAAGAIGTAVGTLKALLQILNLAGGSGGNDLSNPITNAILSILGLVDGAGDCAAGEQCTGLIEIVRALLASAANTIGALIPGAGPIIARLINNFLGPLAGALDTVSTVAITAVINLLRIPAGLLTAAVPAVAPAVNTLLGGLEMVLTCLTTGSPADVTIPAVAPQAIPAVAAPAIPNVVPEL